MTVLFTGLSEQLPCNVACVGYQVQRHAEAQARADAERATLSETVRKLGRELAKLEAFKRNLLHSLQAAEEVSGTPMTQQQSCLSTHALSRLCGAAHMWAVSMKVFPAVVFTSYLTCTHAQEEPQLKNGRAQQAMRTPAQDSLQSPALHILADDHHPYR